MVSRSPDDGVLAEVLVESRLVPPDELADAVDRWAQRMGASGAAVYLVDYAQRYLTQLGAAATKGARVLEVDNSVGGLAYRTQRPTGGIGQTSLPLTLGTHRIGVLEVAGTDADVDQWLPYARLVAELVGTHSAYGDAVAVAHRSRPVALRAEAQRMLLPPWTLETDRVAVAGMLEPSYEVAGDVFDFALNGDTLHVAIIDAMGHSLGATLTAAVVVAAYRNVRREGGSLLDVWEAANEAVAEEFSGERFATCVFAEVNLSTGDVAAVSCGHPSALVVRDGHVAARVVEPDMALPVGLGGDPPYVARSRLQPGDRLVLFTDGVVEARSADGEFFGDQRLIDHLERELGTGLPMPEALRRLFRSVAAFGDGVLGDDATLLVVQWAGPHAQLPVAS